MLFNIGDIVTRKSYNNDTYFEIIDISEDIAYLKGINIRLEADSEIDDLVKVENGDIVDDDLITSSFTKSFNLDRNEFFYLPGKILHIDGDENYLNRCMDFYKKLNVMAYGVCLKENEIADKITSYLEELNPDIVIITGQGVHSYTQRDKIRVKCR